MNDNYSPGVKNVINSGKQEAIRLKHSTVGTEHLMLGILKETEGPAFEVLKALQIDIPLVQKKVELLAASINMASSSDNISNLEQSIHLTGQAERALKSTILELKIKEHI